MSDDENSPKSMRVGKKIKKKSKEEIIFSESDEDDSDYIPDETDDSEFINDSVEYKKFLNTIFPSSYLSSKIKNEKIKKKAFHKIKNSNNIEETENYSENEGQKLTKKRNNKLNKKEKKVKKVKKEVKKVKKKVKKVIKRGDSFKFPTDEEDEEDEVDNMMMNPAKFSIVYTFGDEYQNEEYDNNEDFETEDDTDDEIYENDEDVTEDEWEREMIKEEGKLLEKQKERKKMLEKLKVKDEVKVKKVGWQKKYIGTITKIYKNNAFYDIKLKNKEFETLIKVKDNIILEKFNNNSNNKIPKDIKKFLLLKKTNPKKYNEQVEYYEKDLKEEQNNIKQKKQKKQKTLNSRRLKKLLQEKNVTNDFSYFKNMKISEQKNVLKKLVEINEISTIKKPYKIALIESDIAPEIKAIAMKKVNLLTMMDPSTGDYYKNKLWVDTFMNIPFGKYASLPIKLEDGLKKSQDFMKNAKKILDECVYGLDDAKMQIMQMIGGWISNPNAVGTAIAIQGPMGTGKTTLVKEGISKILNRPFSFIPLGGATDSSYLEGHSYTYEGSIWGKIVDTLINKKCMNPVFYFDELDKVSNTPKGEEIIGILTHLTDTTQNSQFHDKYFSNLDFDLSKALFIFSYNHEEKVNSILKDRMYQIKTKGYDKKEKDVIARNYLIPSIEKNINFKEGEVTFADGVFEHIMEKLTRNEKGVRNLKRCLEIIFSKLNLFRLMEKDTSLFEKEDFINVEFPFEVTIEIVDKLIKQNDKESIPFGMYM